MKTFIYKIAMFASVMVAFGVICELMIRNMTDNPYSYKDKYIKENGVLVNALILGSSHAYYGISPKYFNTNTFSLANTSQPLYYDYNLLSEYIEYMPNLKNVILDVSYFSLRYSGFAKAEDAWYNINYNLYMETSVENSFFNDFAILSSSYLTRKMQSLVTSSKGSMCDSLGWGTDFDIKNKGQQWCTKSANNAVKRHTYKNANYLSKNKTNLCNILELCKSRSINIILVTTPTWHSYYDKIDQSQYCEMLDVIQDLKSEYDFEYYNFMKDSRFTPDDFYDADHLSNIGAEKFSLILANKLGM